MKYRTLLKDTAILRSAEGVLPAKMGVYTYSAFIELSVTLNVHWASEALAGALIGYAVGKTVGKSFRQLRDGEDSDPAVHVSPYILPGAVGVVIQL